MGRLKKNITGWGYLKIFRRAHPDFKRAHCKQRKIGLRLDVGVHCEIVQFVHHSFSFDINVTLLAIMASNAAEIRKYKAQTPEVILQGFASQLQ